MSQGYIYIMTNPALKDMVKIGYATDVESRRKQLSTTALPYEYEVYATYETLLYFLNDDGMVERIVENTPLTPEIENEVQNIKEKGIKELLEEAILDYKIPNPSARRDAVEKIWDALERLKTYYTSLDKKASAAKIVNDMSGGNNDFQTLFNDEFIALTKIGNNYRIRHHETDKVDITDDNYYDYFFNRCLSLMALAIKYLQ